MPKFYHFILKQHTLFAFFICLFRVFFRNFMQVATLLKKIKTKLFKVFNFLYRRIFNFLVDIFNIFRWQLRNIVKQRHIYIIICAITDTIMAPTCVLLHYFNFLSTIIYIFIKSGNLALADNKM